MSTIASLLIAVGIDASGVDKGLAQTQSAISSTTGKIAKVGAGLTAGVTLPLLAVGAAALKSALTVDGAYDTIQAGTGATGKELQGLKDSFAAVASSTPADMQKVAESVTQLNQRLGLTGPVLEKLSRQVLEAGRLGGVEVDIKNVTSAFSAFGVTGKQTTKGMDTLFRVSQATGVGINDLSAIMAKQGGVLSQLGFSFDDTAALIGVMDKAGVNSRAVTSAMSAGLVKLAKDGEAPAAAFKRVGGEIQGFIDKGNDAKALDLAGQVFGTRGAGQFVAALKSGKVNLDDITKSAGLSGQSILGMAEKTKDFPELWQEFKNQATLALAPLAADLLPKLSSGLEVASEKLAAAVKWWDGLGAGSQKAILIALAAAAALGPLLVALGSVAGGISKITTLLGSFSTSMQTAEGQTRRFGTAAKFAAGAAGMAALAASTQVADKETSVLLSTLGGAGVGAMAGPWGLLAGAIGGFALGMSRAGGAAKMTGEDFRNSLPPLTSYADAMDRLGRASSRAAAQIAATALTEANAFSAGQALGLSHQTLVGVVLGSENAMRKYNEATRLSNITTQEEYNALERLQPILGTQQKSLRRTQVEAHDVALATGRFNKALGDVQGRGTIVSRLDTRDWPKGFADVKKLLSGMDLVPKDIRTVFQALGVDVTDKQVRRLAEGIIDVGKAKPSDDWLKFFKGDIDGGERQGREGAAAIRRFLKGAGEQKPNGQPFLSGLSGIIDTARSNASRGGNGIGAALKAGIEGGFSGAIDNLAAMARNAVNAAEAAGRAAADAHSPSRVFARLGKDVGDGLTVGLKGTKPDQERAGADAVDAIAKKITEKAKERAAAIHAIGRLLAKNFARGVDGSREDVVSSFSSLLEQVKVLHDKHLSEMVVGTRNRLTELGGEWDKAHAKLTSAKDKLKALVAEAASYSAQVQSSIAGTGNVTNFTGQLDENGQAIAVTFADIESGLQSAAGQATEFSRTLEALVRMGLNKQSLADLVAKGPAEGLAAAQAILAGGEAAVERVNELYKIISTVGTQVAKLARDSMYGAGIQTMQGLVDGLARSEDKIAQQMRRIARIMIRELRDELGIHSPSTVFAELGTYSGAGLVKGMDGMQSKVAAASARMSSAAIPDQVYAPDRVYAGVPMPTSLGSDRPGSAGSGSAPSYAELLDEVRGLREDVTGVGTKVDQLPRKTQMIVRQS